MQVSGWSEKPVVEYSNEYIQYLPEHIRRLDPSCYLSNNFLVLDFETTTFDKGNPRLEENEIVLAGWWYDGVYKEHYGDEFNQEDLAADISRCDFVVCHNAKFELGWLDRMGLDVANIVVYCTQVGEYVLRGNRSHLGVSLEATAKRRKLPVEKIKVIEKLWALGVDTRDIPRTLLSRYCRIDVLLALAIFLEQRQDIIRLGLLKVMYIRCWMPVVLADIEQQGMCLDDERVAIVNDKVQREFNALFVELDELTGGVDVDSSTQLREHLYVTLKFDPPKKHGKPWLTPKAERTRAEPCAENYSTDAKALKTLKPRTKRQKEFLRVFTLYKEKYGELTKYLSNFKSCCENSGGILYANINQTVTKTHRTSSSGRNYGCQFQNFKSVFKPLFRAREDDWRIVERDKKQLEFAIAVELGQDETGYRDITTGRDLHSQSASVLQPGFDLLEGYERKRARTAAKPDTFKPLYGGTSGTREQQKYYAFFRENYGGITATQEGWIRECLQDKQFRNPPNGLIFYFPYVKINPRSGYVHENEKIRNIPIQSTATADVVPIGLVLLWHLMRHFGVRSFIINTVHDSVLTEEPPEEEETMDNLASWAMEDGVYWVFDKCYNFPLRVPLATETEKDSHWNTNEEWEKQWLC